jgi:hypothetical protein
MSFAPRPPEKRLRLRRIDSMDKGTSRMNPATYKFLQMSGRLEIVVAGKKKLELKTAAFPEVPENEVWANTDEMKIQGLSDNSIATIRKIQK